MDIEIRLPPGSEISGFTLVQNGKRMIIPPTIDHWKKIQISQN